MVRGGVPPLLNFSVQPCNLCPTSLKNGGRGSGAPETEPESEDEGDGEEYIPGTGWHTVWYLADGTTSYEPPVRVTAVQEI